MIEATYLYRFKWQKERYQLSVIADTKEDAEEYMSKRLDEARLKILDKKFKKLGPFEYFEPIYVGDRRNKIR